MAKWDAIVIGSGPNGLAAAITLARAGCSVLVLEAQATIGGGARSAELQLPGFIHDLCSAIHPLARLSPFFRSLPLAEHGLEWIEPPAALAHPFDDGSAAVLYRSLDRTANGLGTDGEAWRRLMLPFVENWERLSDVLGPLHWPPDPLLHARFGLRALPSACFLVQSWFRQPAAKALFAGIAAHSALRLDRLMTAGYGMVLALAAHLVGWPLPRGGAQRISDALASCLRALGGRIDVSSPVRSLEEIDSARAVLCDLTPRQLLAIAGKRLPGRYRAKLERWRYGPAVFKVDWALDGPIPWKSAECAQAATVHLGGSLEEIAAAARAPWQRSVSLSPFVILAQPTLFDSTRAPAGKHTAWAYCHVPLGCTLDVSGEIERQIERFAPGFGERILARSAMPPVALERHNANLVGGDINGGTGGLAQFFLRPTRRLYRTPARGLYLCSSSTPPGGGVHGLCGYYAARAALQDMGVALKSEGEDAAEARPGGTAL